MPRISAAFIFIGLSMLSFGQQSKGEKLEKKFLKLQEQGKTAEATKVMQQICDLNGEVYFSLFDRASDYDRIGRLDSAAKYIGRAISHFGAYPMPATETFLSKKARYCQRGILIMDRVLGQDSMAYLFGDRASLKVELGRYEEAIADYTHAIRLDSLNSHSFYNRGCCYNKLNDLRPAIADFSMAISINDDYSDAYLNRGFVRLKLNQYEEAIDDFKWMLGASPDVKARAYCSNNMGYAYLKLGKTEDAEKYVRQSIDLLPTNSYAYRNLALILLEKDDQPNACKSIEKSLGLGFSQLYGDEMTKLQERYCH